MNPPNLLARIRASRRTSLLVFAGALMALVITAVWFMSTRNQLSRAYQQVDAQSRALNEASVREQEAVLQVEYAGSARQLLAEVERRGLTPLQWGERLVRLNQTQMGREETAALLASLQRNPDRIFGASVFELSVTVPGDGLFTAPPWSERGAPPLQLSIDGSVLFRTDSRLQPADIASSSTEDSAL